ncbi:MAG: hypothetical protein IKC69_02495 [Clostridia bacterium]|nr:hypothetical protein [Clostridia bacterium]
MTRLLGIGLVGILPVLIGEWRRRQYLDIGKWLLGRIDFLEHLTFRIRVFGDAQGEILRAFSGKERRLQAFLDTYARELERDPCGALHRAIAADLEECGASDAVSEAYLAFGERFGMQSRESQVKDCERILALFRHTEEEGRKKRESGAATARVTGLVAGAGIFILLI